MKITPVALHPGETRLGNKKKMFATFSFTEFVFRPLHRTRKEGEMYGGREKGGGGGRQKRVRAWGGGGGAESKTKRRGERERVTQTERNRESGRQSLLVGALSPVNHEGSRETQRERHTQRETAYFMIYKHLSKEK